MKVAWFAGVFVAGATAVFAIAGCSSLAKSILQEPKVQLVHVNVQKVDLQGATLGVGIQVDNPNPFRLKVDALKYKVEIGGKQITESELPAIAEVAGHSSQIVEIPVPVKFQDIYDSALSFLQKSSSNYHITGEARFGLLTIPFDQTGDLKLR